jgi:hypothetical protein
MSRAQFFQLKNVRARPARPISGSKPTTVRCTPRNYGAVILF